MSKSTGRSKIVILKQNAMSPKSITTQVRALKGEETHLKQKRIIGLSKKQEDPTNLNNIVNALKHSSKTKRNNSICYLPSEDENESLDLTSDICDFKNVGDLSIVSFTEENSFQEDTTSNEDHCRKENQSEKTLIKKAYTLDEERTDEYSEDLSHVGVISNQILKGQIQLEDERIISSQLKCLKMRESYLNNLISIWQKTLQPLSMLRAESQHNVALEQKKRKDLLSEVQEDAILKERKYLEEVQKSEDDLSREVEKVSEEALQKEKLIQGLYCHLETFRDSLSKAQEKSGNAPKESELHNIVFQELPSILTSTEHSVAKMLQSTFSTSEADIQLISKRIAEAVLILSNIQRLLDQDQASSTQSTDPEEQSTPVLEAPLSPDTQTIVHPTPKQPVSTQQTQQNEAVSTPQSQDLGQAQENQSSLPSHFPASGEQAQLSQFPAAGEAFSSLKAKYESVCSIGNSTREHVTLRPLLSRAIGIINTVNNQSHDSSNRGKLQQILNLVNGKTCTIGSDTLTTKDNPSAQAFVKEQLASRIVTLSHDKQVLSMAIYASLIVRLWQLVPEIGDLILFKLYETCPFLVPLTIQRREGQTEEEFNRFLGFRHKEGSSREPADKYLTRMGACAELYGRIVSMDIENHPHGIQEGWLWIARTLCMPPYPSVTAALLNGFLSAAGARLLKYYGVQFRKLMQFIWTSYMKQIEEDVLDGGHSDVERLKSFLTQYARTNTIPEVTEGYKLLL